MIVANEIPNSMKSPKNNTITLIWDKVTTGLIIISHYKFREALHVSRLEYSTFLQEYYMLNYIPRRILAYIMPHSKDSSIPTAIITRLFTLTRNVCECGHNRDYHLNAPTTRCVFGICDCKAFKKHTVQ